MRFFLFLFSIFLSNYLSAQSANNVVANSEMYLTAQFEHHMFNGYAIIYDSGKVTGKSYGQANYKTGMPISADTKFLIGSLTKQFTATLILNEVKKKKLFLNKSIEKYFKFYPQFSKITLGQLLNHTSGLSNYTDFPEYSNFEEKNIKISDIVDKVAKHPFQFEPGSSYRYCNSDYLLLGVILEKVTNRSYEQNLKSSIFVPAGMLNSGLFFSDKKYSNFATGYTENIENRIPAIIPHAEFAFAAGQIYSTPNDLLKWNSFLESNIILNDSLRTMMFTPGKEDYGMGWVVKNAGNIKVEFHSGALPGFRSSFYRIPQRQFAFILLSNMDAPSLTEQISNEILSYYFGKPYEVPKFHKILKVNKSILEEYAGKYQINENFFVNVTIENGKLMIEATGQEKHEFFPESENMFFVKFADATVTFNKDAQGKVISALMNMGGNMATAKKVSK